MTKRRPISQLPSIHRTSALERFFGSTVDHLFQPGKAVPVSGYIGRVPSYFDPSKDFYKKEPTPARAQFQLEAAMASEVDGALSTALFYDDLISRLGAAGANTSDPHRLFQTEYWSWAPPVDIDKINNNQRYYWSGDDVPALELTLPGFEVPAFYYGTGLTRRFAMPRSLPCWRILPEDQTTILVGDVEVVRDAAPAVLVNGVLAEIALIDDDDIVLVDEPNFGDVVEVFRYGNVSDGTRTDFAFPVLFNTELAFDIDSDIHVYINGRETLAFTRIDDIRIRLDAPAPANSFVTVTAWNSIQQLCTGKETFEITKLNTFGVEQMINGLKVRLIDPWVYFLGFDVKPNDTFKWDESRANIFYVEGVGTSIHLVDASIFAGLEPQYVVMSRSDPAYSYWSKINRWVLGDALEWFGGKLNSRQARRPICEYVSGLRLFNYGITRAPDADIMYGVFQDRAFPDFSTVDLADDNGRVLAAGDVVLFGDIGDPAYNNSFVVWPAIDSLTNTDDIILEVIYTAIIGDTVAYTSSPDEFKFDGSVWTMVAKHGDFPLFDLFDNNGVSLSDLGEYPETTFAGSRIFCYQVGTGDVDRYLGFAVKHDTYGQIMFENDLYTQSFSYRDGPILGYYYYLVRNNNENKFYNEWYKADGLLPAAGSSPEIVVPLNLQANPNFDTPKFISRNNWFTHFASIVANQENATGQAFSENNWISTTRDLSRGTSIIQSRAPLLKLMLLMGENGFDLQRSISFAEREYTRLKLKVAQKINEGLRDGTLTATLDPQATIIAILKKLVANKNSDFAFALSTIGGSNYFIPPTPATLGIHPMIRPHMTIENGDTYIVGHDGSKVASTDPIIDAVLMAFENLIFDSRQSAYREELRPLVDEFDLMSGKWRTGAYSREEANAIQQSGFEEWARNNSLDYQNNIGFDEDNPFTWNYGSLSDRDGDVIPGNWRGIYRYYFDTETPNLTPWEMLGFAEQPDWWEGLYGAAPYQRSNTAMWTAIAEGRIEQGPRAGVDERFIRTGLMDVLPVDAAGNLLDPVVARIIERQPTIQYAQESWVFGDGGPVETLWRRSSSFGFAKSQAIFLMRPAQFVEYYWDTDLRALVHGDQWIDIPTNDRAAHSELFVHGEVVDGSTKVSMGIQHWIVELMVHQGQRAALLGNVLRGLDVRLAHKMAGFTTPDRMTISAESFGLIPAEDITIALYQSPGLSVDNYSGIIIEHLQASRWRVIGYNATDPYFSIRPSDRGGKRIVLNPSATDDRIVNPWGPSIYYKLGMFVFYNGLVYSVAKNHVSTEVFESEFWEIDSQGFSNDEKLYRFIDGDDSVERLPYATVFRTRQDVIDFIYSYQRDLEARGFGFPDGSWDDAAVKFINWSRVKWANGSFLTLSPAAQKLEYTTPQGYILDLENPFVYNGVINRTGHVIDDRNTKVDRFDAQLTIDATGPDEIYGVSLRRAEIEHVLIFSNRTIFGDIIYDPTFNVRQERLKMSARATTEWTGRYDAPGFIITNGQIVSNFEKSADDIRNMFDIELADNTVLRDHARHVIGFEKRPYLANLLLNDTQQFELYQGMIQQKGALGSLSKIMRSKAVEGNRDLQFMEEWAFKLAEFGAYEPRGYVELLLTQDDMRRQHQLIRLGEPLVAAWKSGNNYEVGDFVLFEDVIYVARNDHTATVFADDLVYNWAIDATAQASTSNAILNIPNDDVRWVSKPLGFDDLVIENSNGFYSLPDAGYIRLNEAEFSAPSFEKFSETAEAFLRGGNSFSAAQCVWIYQRDFNGWSADYIDYPTEDFTAANLVHENFSKSGEWSSSLVGVPETTSVFSYGVESTPNAIESARYLAFVDADGTTSQAGTYLYSKTITGIAPVQDYIFSLTTHVTQGFNGSIHIQVSWFKTDDTPTELNPVSTIGLLDYRQVAAGQAIDYRIFDYLEAPVDAAKAIMRISVEFGTVVPSVGRVYVGNPEFRYGGLGVRVTLVNTADTNSDVTGARFTVDRPHNFEVGDFVLIGGPIVNNFDGVGIFEVTDIDVDWFEIDVDVEVDNIQPYDFTENEEVGPPVYRLRAGRFADKTAAQLETRLNGSLVYVDDAGEGRWAVYRAPDFSNPIRQQPDMIDTSKVASTLIYDKQTKITSKTIQPEPITLARINPVDPMTGILIGAADREIDYKLEYDPAGYTEADGLWTDQYVGRVWWDMSTTWFINPYTDILTEDNTERYLTEIQYRATNWAKLAPGISIDLYEWTKSRTAPVEVEGEPPIQFVIASEFEPALGRDVAVYYFWVKNPNIIPDVPFRKLDCKNCASILTNPSLADVPWMAVISNKEMIYSGVRDYLNDDSTVAQTLLQLTDWDEDVPHVQWSLVRPNDPRSQPPVQMWDKLITSLVGFDENLKAIPSKTLHNKAQTGIAYGQSMFDVEKNALARESLVTMINYQLARRNFGSDPTFGDEWLTFRNEPIQSLSWVKLDDQSLFSLLPPASFYDEKTNDPAIMSEIFADVTTPVGYRVLLDNRFSENPSWSVWEKLIDDEISVAQAYETTVAARSDLDALVLTDGARVLVENDSTYEGFWTINEYDLATDAFTVVWAQTYDTTDFWEYSDWYAFDYDETVAPIVTYATISERNQSEVPVNNLLVKILDNGAGYWIWTAFINGAWETVAQQGGTIQLNDTLFTNTAEYGWSRETEDYAFDGTKVRLRKGSYELRILFNELINKPILTLAEKNELWFAMVNFIHAHHDQVDWAFKTSFLSVVGYNEALVASPVTSPDTTKDILRYVDEVKPYHVTVRDFSRSFAALDIANIVVTDFDKPIYYDEDQLKYRVLNHNDPVDNAIMQNGVWKYWLDNMDKARRIHTTMKLDRVWFEDNGPSSGAANRIMAFYNPTPDMKPKNLNVLLGLDFKGTILEGMEFDDNPTEVTIATGDGTQDGVNGILDDLTEGFQMRDPRVAENTPEELVRLGAHDVFLLRAHDKWGAGAPMGTINTYDVEREQLDIISLRVDALARDVVVFFDGVRVTRDSEFIFNQFGNSIDNVLLVKEDGSRVKTVTIHAFGYAGHASILDQVLVSAEQTGTLQVSVPRWIIDDGFAYSHEVTIAGRYVLSSMAAGVVTCNAMVNDQVVVTFYKTATPNTTRLVIKQLPQVTNPIGTNDVVSDPDQIADMTGNTTPYIFLDMKSQRAFDGDLSVPNLNISTLSTPGIQSIVSNEPVLILSVFEGSDLIVTRDNSGLGAGTAHRALQIRNINNIGDVLVTIGTNGIYSGAATLTATQIPATADVMAFHNTTTGRKVILVVSGTQSLLFDEDGTMLKSLGDLAWTSGQSFAVQAMDSIDYLTVILVNPASVTKPVYRLQIAQFTDVTVSSFTIGELATWGTMSIKSAAYDPSDNAMIFFANRAAGGDVIFKYDLSGGFVKWSEWSGHLGETDRFSLPRDTSSSRLSEGFHFVWGADNTLFDLNPRDGSINTISSLSGITADSKQAWSETGGILGVYRSGNTELVRVIVSFADAGFVSTFDLDSLSLRRPFISSMFVEVNGKRLAPPRMLHFANTTDYFIGDRISPEQIRILDDTGFLGTATVLADDAYDTIDEVYAAGLSARFVYWRQNIILLDEDALARNYTLIVRNTGEFNIDDNTAVLTINSLHSTDVVKVLHWRNDYIMEPTTWSFKARSSGIYRIRTRARQGKSWVSINGLRLVEDVDYSILPTVAGAWDIESFDTFRYDSLEEVDITIKNTLKGRENDLVVITTFEGPEASPPLDWQTDTTTPSIYRFKKLPDEYIEVGVGEYVREPKAWEVSTSDLLREGGRLETDMLETEDLASFTITINPLDAPSAIQNIQPVPVPDRGANVPGVVWIEEERIEYFDRVVVGDTVTFSEIRRGTRGTPKAHHTVGEFVTVQNIKRRIPKLPQGDLPVPPMGSGPDDITPDEPIFPIGSIQKIIPVDMDASAGRGNTSTIAAPMLNTMTSLGESGPLTSSVTFRVNWINSSIPESILNGDDSLLVTHPGNTTRVAGWGIYSGMPLLERDGQAVTTGIDSTNYSSTYVAPPIVTSNYFDEFNGQFGVGEGTFSNATGNPTPGKLYLGYQMMLPFNTSLPYSSRIFTIRYRFNYNDGAVTTNDNYFDLSLNNIDKTITMTLTSNIRSRLLISRQTPTDPVPPVGSNGFWVNGNGPMPQPNGYWDFRQELGLKAAPNTDNWRVSFTELSTFNTPSANITALNYFPETVTATNGDLGTRFIANGAFKLG